MTKTVTSSVICKHCGATVMVEKQNVRDTDSLTGGITTSMCRKCHKTSSYTYQIKGGQFTQLR
jgi:RNase P subunit RPR2